MMDDLEWLDGVPAVMEAEADGRQERLEQSRLLGLLLEPQRRLVAALGAREEQLRARELTSVRSRMVSLRVGGLVVTAAVLAHRGMIWEAVEGLARRASPSVGVPGRSTRLTIGECVRVLFTIAENADAGAAARRTAAVALELLESEAGMPVANLRVKYP